MAPRSPKSEQGESAVQGAGARWTGPGKDLEAGRRLARAIQAREGKALPGTDDARVI